MAAKQGFLMYYSKGDAIGTKVSVRYRRSGRLSGVVVKRGSTVHCICFEHGQYMHIISLTVIITIVNKISALSKARAIALCKIAPYRLNCQNSALFATARPLTK